MGICYIPVDDFEFLQTLLPVGHSCTINNKPVNLVQTTIAMQPDHIWTGTGNGCQCRYLPVRYDHTVLRTKEIHVPITDIHCTVHEVQTPFVESNNTIFVGAPQNSETNSTP
jgi:hypothetical protein